MSGEPLPSEVTVGYTAVCNIASCGVAGWDLACHNAAWAGNLDLIQRHWLVPLDQCLPGVSIRDQGATVRERLRDHTTLRCENAVVVGIFLSVT